MARVLNHYRGEAQGGATFYMYDRPSTSSPATRVYNGDLVTLPPDYLSMEVNGMWPTINPGGWMFYYNVGSLEPVYYTEPDRCTPPDSVTLEDGVVKISGGAGGDENEFLGWGLSYRDRSVNDSVWGEWCEDLFTRETEIQVSMNSGKVRQFRVRTMGSAGESYYSDYVICEKLLNGNSAAGVPTVELPVAGGASRMHSPCVRISCPPDPDGDPMSLMRRIDNGRLELAVALEGTGGVVYDQLPYLEEGEHVVEYLSRDINNLDSGVDRVSFTVQPAVWTREIAPGTVISSREVSHRADIAELLEAVNGIRAFYGLGEVELPGTVGRFADWQGQMQLLLSAAGDVYDLMHRARPDWPEVPAFPTASVVNAVREACEA